MRKEIKMQSTFLDTEKGNNEKNVFRVKELAVFWRNEGFSRHHLRKEVISNEFLERRRQSPRKYWTKGKQPESISKVWMAKKIAVNCHLRLFSKWRQRNKLHFFVRNIYISWHWEDSKAKSKQPYKMESFGFITISIP